MYRLCATRRSWHAMQFAHCPLFLTLWRVISFARLTVCVGVRFAPLRFCICGRSPHQRPFFPLCGWLPSDPLAPTKRVQATCRLVQGHGFDCCELQFVGVLLLVWPYFPSSGLRERLREAGMALFHLSSTRVTSQECETIALSKGKRLPKRHFRPCASEKPASLLPYFVFC